MNNYRENLLQNIEMQAFDTEGANMRQRYLQSRERSGSANAVPKSPRPLSTGDQTRSDLKRKLEEMKKLIDEQRQMQSQILTLDIDKDNVMVERRAPAHAAKYPSY